MMNRMMKFVSVLAVLAMLLSCFAACSKPSDDELAGTLEEESTTAQDVVAESDTESASELESETESSTDSETDTEGTSETDSGTESETESESESESESETETELPRFDYFSANMADYVTIDPAVYESIEVTLAADLQITDADVERYIMELLYNKRETESETMVDEPLEWGDDAYIYYTGYLDGVPFEGGSNADGAKPSLLGLGSGAFIPGFEDGLVGVVPSQTSKEEPVSISLRFPSWYQSADLAGKEVVFEVYVVYAVENTLPEYNVTFVEDVLMYDFKEEFYASDRARLAEFEAYVREYLENSMEQTVVVETDEAMMDILMAAATFKSLPEEEVAYYRAYYMNQFESMYEYYKMVGIFTGTFDEFVRTSMGLDKDTGDWEAELDRGVTENIHYDMVYYAIAEQEGMKTISDEEFDAKVQYWLDYYKETQGITMTKEEFLEEMGEENVRRSVLSSKVTEFLSDRVTVVYA